MKGEFVSIEEVMELPIDRRHAVTDQVVIAACKVMIAEESVVSRERRGVSRTEHQVA